WGEFAAGDGGGVGEDFGVDGEWEGLDGAVAEQEVHGVGVQAAPAAIAGPKSQLAAEQRAAIVVAQERAAFGHRVGAIIGAVGIGPKRPLGHSVRVWIGLA